MKSHILLILAFILPFGIKAYQKAAPNIDFLPLNVGNVWVYTNSGMPPGPNRSRLTITGSYVVNGKLYYNLQLQFTSSFGCQPNPFSYNVSGIRIDSLTGNVTYQNTGGCSYSPDSKLIDSLAAKKNNTYISDCYWVFTCTDTNNYSIFGIPRPARTFRTPFGGEYYIRRYAKNIGIFEQNHGITGIIDCNSYLLGAVINGVLYGDTSFPVGITQILSGVPTEYFLEQNYPNPFNPITHFGFRIRDFGFVRLTVFDILGREITVLVNENLRPGTYEAEWDASRYPSGVYFYRLTAGESGQGFSETEKMILIK